MRKNRIAWGLSFVAGTIAVVPLFGAWQWRLRDGALRDRLDAAAAQVPAALSGAFGLDDVAELPEPAARYLRHVLKDGQPLIRAVELVTDGEFNATGAAGDWRPFHATQRFTTLPAGFVWNARIKMAPFMSVFVRDAYVDGRGEMAAKVMALYPVASEAGSAGLAAGQLSRYLGETMWFPTALLPGQGVIWQPIDRHSALASMLDYRTAVSLRFTFNDEGDVIEVFAPDRFRAVNGRHEPTPWAVRCSQHEERNGIRIPMWCEAEWQLPAGPLPYWRGRVTDIKYELAR